MSREPGPLQLREESIDLRIVQELISLLPEAWNGAVLEVSRELGENGMVSFPNEISSTENRKEVVVPSGEIFSCIFALDDLFAEFGAQWDSVRYAVRLEDDGSWSYRVSFHYPGVLPASSEEAPDPK